LTIILPAQMLYSSTVIKEHDMRPRACTRLAESAHPALSRRPGLPVQGSRHNGTLHRMTARPENPNNHEVI